MTTVTVFQSPDGTLSGFDCRGHADFADAGEDIVCAALSSVIQTAALGLFRVAGLREVRIERDDAAARFAIRVGALNKADRHDADTILETMLAGVADLHESFSKFIKLEVI